MATQTIEAIQVHNYGGADELKLERIQRPTPQEGEVLVHVYAAGVNPVDWKIRAGWMKDFRPMPMPFIPGRDIAGIEEQVQQRDIQVKSFAANVTSELLQTFAQLISERHIKVVVGKTFLLSQAREAQELSESGHGSGRIVLHIAG